MRLPVHPRRRGEHWRIPGMGGDGVGSSPQARGTHGERDEGQRYGRFIPAGAGNTRWDHRLQSYNSVHPRRRGEHRIVHAQPIGTLGSSPQARGTHVWLLAAALGVRFIPAGAGNTHYCAFVHNHASVHPRRRGENLSLADFPLTNNGSSPQARGTRLIAYNLRGPTRFIPAGAGNTVLWYRRQSQNAVHPRRRGEHAVARDDHRPVVRFIPAGAGNTAGAR